MIKRFNSKFLGTNSTLVYNEEAAFIIDPGVFPEEINFSPQHIIKIEFNNSWSMTSLNK
jgi:hypothetical protein